MLLSKYLLVQSQQWNMFNVNSKDTRIAWRRSGVFIVKLEDI